MSEQSNADEAPSAMDGRRPTDLVETSKTLRRTMFVHVAFCFFCAFTLLSRPDKDLIGAGSTVQVPLPLVSQFEMSFRGFLVVGPLLVLAITVYLHVFLEHLMALKKKASASVAEAPYLFNLGHASSDFLSHVIFFWLTPAVLALFAWKALSLPIGLLLFMEFAVATGWSIWLVRRRRADRRDVQEEAKEKKEKQRAGSWLRRARPWLAAAAATLVLALAYTGWLRGQLRAIHGMGLYQADLSGQDLRDRLLTRADLREASLRGANLAGAVLRRAQLAGADLSDAELAGADLRRADLTDARLAGANLAGADLTDANLSGAELAAARNLRQEQLDSTCHDLLPASYPRGLLPPLPCDLREAGARPPRILDWAEDEALNRRLRSEGGDFLMGAPESEGGLADEQPQHRVTVSTFYLQEHEVTREEWARFHHEPPLEPGEERHPVVDIPWHWALAYAAWLGGSLPTEAQWEYAARAGSTGPWSFGDDGASIGEHAWYSDNSGDEVHPVGSKLANAWDLYDVHGNVWEWCLDWYGPYPPEARTDPRGPDSGLGRVVRGGSFRRVPRYLRSAARGYAPPEATAETVGDFGFRVAFPAGSAAPSPPVSTGRAEREPAREQGTDRG